MQKTAFSQLISFNIKKLFWAFIRTPDKACISISKMPISSPNPMFDNLLESSHQDNSNELSNIGFGEETTRVESIEVHFMHLIWGPDLLVLFKLDF